MRTDYRLAVLPLVSYNPAYMYNNALSSVHQGILDVNVVFMDIQLCLSFWARIAWCWNFALGFHSFITWYYYWALSCDIGYCSLFLYGVIHLPQFLNYSTSNQVALLRSSNFLFFLQGAHNHVLFLSVSFVTCTCTYRYFILTYIFTLPYLNVIIKYRPPKNREKWQYPSCSCGLPSNTTTAH